MKIYVFRHAQKAMDFSGDPDLTTEGHAQASRLLDKVLKEELPRPTELWVSPKKRTHSTFRPLAQHLGLQLIVQEDLLEQKSDESLSEFRLRVTRTLEAAATRKDSVVFLCSHYDWVVEAMAVAPSDTDLSGIEFSHWSPAQHVGFHVKQDGVFEFIELKRISL